MIRKYGGWLRNQIKNALKYGDIYIDAVCLVKEKIWKNIMMPHYQLSMLKHFDADWCLLKSGIVVLIKRQEKVVIA